MLAFSQSWRPSALDGSRMAASLGLPAPDRLTWSQIDTSTYARLSGIWDPPQRHGLRPAAPTILPSGDRVLFTGWLDNRQEIAIRLGIEDRDAAWVYGHAVDRWGDEADLHVIGEYCAVIDRPRMAEVRLVRSPLCAPPLHYHRSALGIAAASVPRALFALGLPVELDEDRLAMQLHAAAYDAEGGWYKGIEALQPGVIVTASRDGERRVRPYDPLALPEVRLARDEDYVQAAEDLLGEGISRTLAGFRQPATLLTGGLDSTIVASHVLDRLPARQPLPSYTWTSEAGVGLTDSAAHFVDEKSRVEAFAAMHPRIEPHFLDNAGRSFDDGWADLFMLGGVTTTAIGLLYPYGSAFAAARKRGCDLVIGAGFGNGTFSNEGRRGYFEFPRRGKFRQMWRALKARNGDDRPVWRRFATLVLLRSLPYPLWRAVSRWQGVDVASVHQVAGALNPNWPGRPSLEAAAQGIDPALVRPFYRSRREEVAAMAGQMDADGQDLMQAYQQRNQIAYRDVTTYRPFLEFCWRLPVEQLMRDGESRFLARRMGIGRLPEEIRTETRYGLQHGDWHLRLGRQLGSLKAELKSLEHDPQVGRLVDIPRLIRLLEDFPASDRVERNVALQYQITLPNGIAAARLIRSVSGRND